MEDHIRSCFTRALGLVGLALAADLRRAERAYEAASFQRDQAEQSLAIAKSRERLTRNAFEDAQRTIRNLNNELTDLRLRAERLIQASNK